MAKELNLQVVSSGNDSCTFIITGRLDLDNYDLLDQAFTDALDTGFIHIRADLAGVDYISSAGFGIFIEAMGTVQQRGGSLTFVNLSNKARAFFKLLGVMVDACETHP